MMSHALTMTSYIEVNVWKECRRS